MFRRDWYSTAGAFICPMPTSAGDASSVSIDRPSATNNKLAAPKMTEIMASLTRPFLNTVSLFIGQLSPDALQWSRISARSHTVCERNESICVGPGQGNSSLGLYQLFILFERLGLAIKVATRFRILSHLQFCRERIGAGATVENYSRQLLQVVVGKQ
jgi:hypothetical protein